MAIKTTNSRSDAAALCVITNLFVLENIDMYISVYTHTYMDIYIHRYINIYVTNLSMYTFWLYETRECCKVSL